LLIVLYKLKIESGKTAFLNPQLIPELLTINYYSKRFDSIRATLPCASNPSAINTPLEARRSSCRKKCKVLRKHLIKK
jgi:hypothetical protein